MSLIGLDLNATRARAVHGPVQNLPAAMKLGRERNELPLAISLEERVPEVGRAGAALCRRAPHLACLDYLSHLDQPRKWIVGKHSLDAGQALLLFFRELHMACARAKGMAIATPAYLSESQAVRIGRLAEQSALRIHAIVPTPVAAAIAAQPLLPWTGLALVVDVDGAALTWSAVTVDAREARLIECQAAPRLALGAWLNRTLEYAADRCVRLTRRDPRQSAEAEQALYDQLAALFEKDLSSDRIDLHCEANQWSQHLMLHPADLAACCTPLVQQTLALMRGFLAKATGHGPAAAVLVTPSASRLPGLVAALEEALGETARPKKPRKPTEGDDDFGDCLLLDDEVAAAQVHVLDDDAVARATHFLAGRVSRGDLPRGYHEVAPLPEGAFADPGPGRLQFRGQEHPLADGVFTIGRAADCDLIFETELYPTVSTKHCEIVLDRRAYMLRDRSRHGTLVNDRPVPQQVALHSGDWIRLGPSGPVLRFLGQPHQQGRMNVTKL
jgi:hypothetical protein